MFSLCHLVAVTFEQHREVRWGHRLRLGAREHLDLRRNRTFGKLLVTHPKTRFVGKQDFDACTAARDEHDAVSFPRLDARNAAFAEQAQMAFAEIDPPKCHNDALDKQRTQHEVNTPRSSGDKADTATSTVTLPDANRNVSV